MSADGAYVIFTSAATNLVDGQSDTNGAEDVFLFERATGAVSLVSHAAHSATTAGDGYSMEPSISADGGYVAFYSAATNLVAGQNDANDESDVFVFERATGALTLVSHTPDGPTTAANGWSGPLSISANGAYVAFESTATNLVSGQIDVNDGPWSPATGWPTDTFLFERATGALTLVSHTPASSVTTGNRASCCSTVASISADGAYVVFRSMATDLVSGQNDTNGNHDAFVFDRATGTVTLVSHTATSTTTTSNAGDFGTSISPDGAYLWFASAGTDLVSGQNDTNGTYDVFLVERATGAVRLVSHTPASPTTTGNGLSVEGSLSADASFMAFRSFATNLVAGQSDTNNNPDIFLFERATGAVTLVSHSPSSPIKTVAGGSASASISADGAFVVFVTGATDMVGGQNDANGMSDVFLFHRATGVIALVSHVPARPTTTGNRASCCWDDTLYGTPSLSADGSFVAFPSKATDLVSGQIDGNGDEDVFLYQRLADPDAPPGDFDGDGDTDVAVFRPSNGLWFVEGGPTVAFGTNGDVPVPGDYDGDGDTDMAVFRPSNGVWFVRGGPIVQFGTTGDVALPLPDAIRRFFTS
jgi:Tol biopolymer transport system component